MVIDDGGGWGVRRDGVEVVSSLDRTMVHIEEAKRAARSAA
jgi:hypothetical protein